MYVYLNDESKSFLAYFSNGSLYLIVNEFKGLKNVWWFLVPILS